ncbi:hypothetical protein [Motiliproteus sp. SC1-56]|uniref:hypothetical protein n=1 Tax=Motiliproteus sp. SC1-56 TaxID=2799565 RepID=UPI001A8C57B2|nr:hypothetical protein [Motiliproteus sp. SC1-56]
MKIVQHIDLPEYCYYIKGEDASGYWVFRYSAAYRGGAVPESRVVYYGHNKEEALLWIEANPV